MDGKPPLAVLKDLGYNGDEAIALFPPIILDRISADLILSCDKEVGNDLLAHYRLQSHLYVNNQAKGTLKCPAFSPKSFTAYPTSPTFGERHPRRPIPDWCRGTRTA